VTSMAVAGTTLGTVISRHPVGRAGIAASGLLGVSRGKDIADIFLNDEKIKNERLKQERDILEKEIINRQKQLLNE
jgi:hypothetical protein